MFKRALCALILLSSSLTANEPGWHTDHQVSAYADCSELQRHWALELIGRHPFSGDERVLDYGCGDGKITATLSHLLPNGHITGVDLSEAMIRHAQRRFPLLSFPRVDFCPLTEWNKGELYDCICSFCVFHLVPNPVEVLTRLRSQLKPSGQALFIIPSNGDRFFPVAASKALEHFGLSEPSNEGQPNLFDSLEAMRAVEEAGWHIVSACCVKTPFTFYDREECIAWMVGTLTAVWGVPPEIAPDLFSLLFDRLIAYDPEILQEDGAVVWRGCYTEIVATK